MSLSAALTKVAAKVLKQFGVNCTFTDKDTASFDPATGIRTTTDTSFTAYGVKESYTQDEIDGTVILASDVKLIIERSEQMPEVGNTCVIGSDSYRIMSVKATDPDNYDIIYEVQLRL